MEESPALVKFTMRLTDEIFKAEHFKGAS